MRSRGFTLLEVMVVLVIVGLLLSMVNLNSSDRAAQNETEQFARQLLGAFNQYRDEAVFQNIDLGVAILPEELGLLAWQNVFSQEFTTGLSVKELDALKKNPWQPFDGRMSVTRPVPENIDLRLFVEEEEIDIAELYDEDEGPRPAILFLSSDEYTAFELRLTHVADEGFQVTVSGDGFNPVLSRTERFGE